jgi:type I restriction enzyme S subunit
MNKYEVYKSTNLDWIGTIPEQWETIRVKGNCYVKGRIGWQELKSDEFVDEGIHCVTGTDFQNQFVNWNSCYRVGLERYLIDDNIQLKEGDVLITKDGTIGKTALVKNMPEKATLNSGIFLVRPNKKKLANEYLYWILNSPVFEEYNNYTKTGSTILHLYQNVLVEMLFPLPSTPEQLAIANYLDHQTQNIDRLIANKKAQAEKLKELRQIEINNAVTKGLNPSVEMKDSGIDWMGEIPKHWEVKHLKRAFNFYNSIRIPLSSEERADLENIYDYYGASGVIDKVDRFLFDGEYILIGEDGANLLDRNSPLAFKVSGRFWVNNHAHIIKPVKGDIDFYTFFLESIDFTIYITGSAQPKLTIEALSGVRVIVPPIEEQIQIAEYLKERTESMDKLMKNVQTQIEKLQELRKIKIYEAVTGKIKVNAYVEATT